MEIYNQYNSKTFWRTKILKLWNSFESHYNKTELERINEQIKELEARRFLIIQEIAKNAKK